MTPGSFNPSWIAAAEYERVRRAARYPALVRDGKLAAEAATLDYQAWCAIAEWMATGRCLLIGEWGGVAEPPVNVISWALLEASAKKALDGIDLKLAKAPDPALQARREAIWCIHNVMVRQRELVEATARQVQRVRDEAEATA